MDFFGARDYILKKLHNELDKKLCYHNLAHTLDVHQAVVRLSKLEKIQEHSGLILETAALYHDSGMLIKYENHESYSVTIANETLPGFGYSKEEIEEVANLIRVTCLPQKATNQTEGIICDADMEGLASDDFFIQSFNLRREWENFNIRRTSLTDWFLFETKFMEDHHYFTPSAISLWNKQKLRILKEIKDLLHNI